MTTFTIFTLGCKVNQYESQQIRELLEHCGLQKTEQPIKADLIVVNTCCVTHTASSKSRQFIRKAHRYNPDSTIVVSGCLPTVQIGELSAPAKNVHLVTNRSELAATLRDIAMSKIVTLEPQSPQSCPDYIKAKNGCKIKYKNEMEFESELPELTRFEGQTRAFLKIQDGCNGYCRYCIVPKTRPKVRSKPENIVIKEAQALVGAGHKEIVITGVFLGAYGMDTVHRKNWPQCRNDKLADLLDKLAKIENLERIRLSSLEPADVTPRLLDTLCRHRNIMPHLHLSLQSGSDAVLKKMCRQYDAEQFRETVALVKERLDRPAITTDIIVGFPGETDADFEETVALAKEIGFAKMHVFTFSPRKGTAAADMPDQVETKVIKERSKILRKLDAELGFQFRSQFVGEAAEVLVENDNGKISGRCERYFMVQIKNPPKSITKNQIRRVRLTKNLKTTVSATIADR